MEQDTVSTGTAEPVVRVLGLAVIMINVSDLDRSVSFYKEMLGFEEREQMLSPGITLTAGDMMIYLNDGRAPVERTYRAYPEISLAMAVRGVKESYDRLSAAGVTIVQEYDQPSDFFATFEIADPDGNLLAIWGSPG